MMKEIRVSRRPRKCDRDCQVPIRVGQRAEHISIPPGGADGLCGNGWAHMVAHAGPCPDADTMPAEDLAAARSELDAWIDTQLDLLNAEVSALVQAAAEVTR